MIVIDECHRGSAWMTAPRREILDYFKTATHIGLDVATPKETETVSSTEYFKDPIYTYSLKQGIQDGCCLYKVLRVGLNVDLEGLAARGGQNR